MMFNGAKFLKWLEDEEDRCRKLIALKRAANMLDDPGLLEAEGKVKLIEDIGQYFYDLDPIQPSCHV